MKSIKKKSDAVTIQSMGVDDKKYTKAAGYIDPRNSIFHYSGSISFLIKGVNPDYSEVNPSI